MLEIGGTFSETYTEAGGGKGSLGGAFTFINVPCAKSAELIPHPGFLDLPSKMDNICSYFNSRGPRRTSKLKFSIK